MLVTARRELHRLAAAQHEPTQRVERGVVRGAGGDHAVQVGQLGAAFGDGDQVMRVEPGGAVAAEQARNRAAVTVTS